MVNAPDLAYTIAALVHHGQTRRGGQSYVTHCARVARCVMCNLPGGPDYYTAHDNPVVWAAWLHDAAEDQNDRWSIISDNFPVDVRRLVHAVTRSPLESYSQFIDRVIGSGEDASRIKWADIIDNITDRPSPDAHARYVAALDAISRAFPDAAWRRR